MNTKPKYKPGDAVLSDDNVLIVIEDYTYDCGGIPCYVVKVSDFKRPLFVVRPSINYADRFYSSEGYKKLTNEEKAFYLLKAENCYDL